MVPLAATLSIIFALATLTGATVDKTVDKVLLLCVVNIRKSFNAMSMSACIECHAPSDRVRHAQLTLWLTATSKAAAAASYSEVYFHKHIIMWQFEI